MQTSASKMFNRALKVEMKYIDDAKYFRGIDTNSDPGQDFIIKWSTTSAGMFREMFDSSICKNCQHCEDCGHYLKKECKNFKEG
jgi:hypothetical protein